MTYTYDNYTNAGFEFTLAATKNWIFQLGLTTGTESLPWHVGVNIANPFPSPLYPGATMPKDPGAVPSATAGARWTSNDGKDDINIVANGINGGQWGYNNLQWYGLTYYHKFNDQWHISIETYNEHQNDVPNLNNADSLNIIARGGTPFSPQYMPFNAPNGAFCKSATVLSCTASFQTFLAYLNYKVSPLDNITYRAEFVDDSRDSVPAPRRVTSKPASAGSTGSRRRSKSGPKSPITDRWVRSRSTAMQTLASRPTGTSRSSARPIIHF